MADKAFDIRTIVADMQTIVDAMKVSDGSHFASKVSNSRKLGVKFAEILAHARKTDEAVTPTGCYSANEKVLSKVVGKTIMLNECYPLATVPAAQVTADLAAYRTVGRKDKGKPSDRWFNKDGSPKLRLDLFAACTSADAKKWNRTTGVYTPASGNATKITADKLEQKSKAVGEAMEKVMVGVSDTDWDLRYFTEQELTALTAALKLEQDRRKAGGEILTFA